MGNENLWYLLAALFGIVGIVHFVRALNKAGNRRDAGFAMAGASLIWGATALILRFVGIYPAGLVALAAIGCMLLAAVLSGRIQ